MKKIRLSISSPCLIVLQKIQFYLEEKIMLDRNIMAVLKDMFKQFRG